MSNPLVRAEGIERVKEGREAGGSDVHVDSSSPVLMCTRTFGYSNSTKEVIRTHVTGSCSVCWGGNGWGVE